MIHDLQNAHELVMVVPWPLKARALCYPPVSSIKPLTPSWDQAPAAENVTILFTFIESWNKLKSWDKTQEPGTLADDVRSLQAVVRYNLVIHNGYEVEGEDGNFVCAFHAAFDALRFSVAVQKSLLEVEWSSRLLSSKWGFEERTASGKIAFRGFRVLMGMCSGNAMRVQPCARTARIEYYGPIMNHAARVAIAAHGGQILLHQSTWNQLLSMHCTGLKASQRWFTSYRLSRLHFHLAHSHKSRQRPQSSTPLAPCQFQLAKWISKHTLQSVAA
uniref:Adenylate cyclase n=1 Tax=Tetraselmis sp. GSL018 TaxID=582737 RepID=A0A061RW70_9CHLO